MLIALPVSQADSKLALQLVEFIAGLGGIRPHKWFLAFAESCPDSHRKSIELQAARSGDIAASVILEKITEKGWPLSCNAMFGAVARLIAKAGAYGEPCWYFFEADNTPLVPQWADILQAEYTKAKMPCMGYLNDTNLRRPSGVRYVDGQHLVGTGIYPPNFYYDCRLMKFLGNAARAFDVYLQWEVVPQTHPTNELIQHNWITEKYKKVGSDILCSSKAAHTKGAYSKAVRSDAVVLHGCKDGSLMKLLSK